MIVRALASLNGLNNQNNHFMQRDYAEGQSITLYSVLATRYGLTQWATYSPLAQGSPSMAIDQSSPNEYQDIDSQDNALAWPDFSVLPR